jgi:hypothetical protein
MGAAHPITTNADDHCVTSSELSVNDAIVTMNAMVGNTSCSDITPFQGLLDELAFCAVDFIHRCGIMPFQG